MHRASSELQTMNIHQTNKPISVSWRAGLYTKLSSERQKNSQKW